MSNITKYAQMISGSVTELPPLAYNTDIIDLSAPLNLLNDKIRMDMVEEENEDVFDGEEEVSGAEVDTLVEEVCDKCDEALNGDGGEDISAAMSRVSNLIGDGLVHTINLLKNDVNPKVEGLLLKVNTLVQKHSEATQGTTSVDGDIVKATQVAFEVLDWKNISDAAGGKDEITNKWKSAYPEHSGTASIHDFHNGYETMSLPFSPIILHGDTKEVLIKQLNNGHLSRERADETLSLVMDATSLRQRITLDCLSFEGIDYAANIGACLRFLSWYNGDFAKYRKVELDLDDATSAKFHTQNELIDKSAVIVNYFLHCLRTMYNSTGTLAISDEYLNAPGLKKFMSEGYTVEDIRKHVYCRYTRHGLKIPYQGIKLSTVVDDKEWVDNETGKIVEDVEANQAKVNLHFLRISLEEVGNEYLDELHEASPDEEYTSSPDFRYKHGHALTKGLSVLGVDKNVSAQSILYDLVLSNEHLDTQVAKAHHYFNEETISTISDRVEDGDVSEVELDDTDIGMITTAVAARLAIDALHSSKILVPVTRG